MERRSMKLMKVKKMMMVTKKVKIGSRKKDKNRRK
jgi:hypothetical protein